MNKKIYFWACDFSENSGEGKLAKLLLKKFQEKYNCIKIKKNNLNFLKRIIDYKYISPFYGIIICWLNYLKKEGSIHKLFAALEFFYFFISIPKTIIGPITGGANYKNKFNW